MIKKPQPKSQSEIYFMKLNLKKRYLEYKTPHVHFPTAISPRKQNKMLNHLIPIHISSVDFESCKKQGVKKLVSHSLLKNLSQF
jgi:hypothetical protein